LWGWTWAYLGPLGRVITLGEQRESSRQDNRREEAPKKKRQAFLT
jgi:hypothetical protein